MAPSAPARGAPAGDDYIDDVVVGVGLVPPPESTALVTGPDWPF